MCHLCTYCCGCLWFHCFFHHIHWLCLYQDRGHCGSENRPLPMHLQCLYYDLEWFLVLEGHPWLFCMRVRAIYVSGPSISSNTEIAVMWVYAWRNCNRWLHCIYGPVACGCCYAQWSLLFMVCPPQVGKDRTFTYYHVCQYWIWPCLYWLLVLLISCKRFISLYQCTVLWGNSKVRL